MILKRIKVNVGNILGVNCYIVQDEETKETMVIDPGGSVDKILDMLNTLNAKVKYIVLTHCHGDHTGGVLELKEKVGGTVLIHRFDEPGLHSPEISLTSHIGIQKIDIEENSRLDEGDTIHIGNNEFKIIHTPGHTIGGMCIYSEKEKMLFSGDTIFKGSWGRTDLPTSSFEDIINSITNKLMCLPGDVIVYPGHGRPTRIIDEEPIYLELKAQQY